MSPEEHRALVEQGPAVCMASREDMLAIMAERDAAKAETLAEQTRLSELLHRVMDQRDAALATIRDLRTTLDAEIKHGSARAQEVADTTADLVAACAKLAEAEAQRDAALRERDEARSAHDGALRLAHSMDVLRADAERRGVLSGLGAAAVIAADMAQHYRALAGTRFLLSSRELDEARADALDALDALRHALAEANSAP